MRVQSKCRLSQEARERWIHQGVNYTQQWDLQLCTSTSEQREHTTPTSTVASTALKCGKITEFQGLTFSPDRVLLLPLSDRLMRPDKNRTLTSREGLPSLGCNSMILKLFKLFIQTKSWNIQNLKIPFMLCRSIYIYTHTHFLKIVSPLDINSKSCLKLSNIF